MTWKQFTDQKLKRTDFVSQVQRELLTSNFARYVGVTKDLHQWRRHGDHVTWLQFTTWIQNKD